MASASLTHVLECRGGGAAPTRAYPRPRPPTCHILGFRGHGPHLIVCAGRQLLYKISRVYLFKPLCRHTSAVSLLAWQRGPHELKEALPERNKAFLFSATRLLLVHALMAESVHFAASSRARTVAHHTLSARNISSR